MTPAQRDVLEFAAKMDRVHASGTGMFTGRLLRKRDADRCVANGWLVKKRLRVLKGDFAAEPERFRWGYVITPAGKAALLRADKS